MSITLVAIRFISSLMFTISYLNAKFHFNGTYRSIKVDHSLTEVALDIRGQI